MFKLTGFSDEIDPSLEKQLEVLGKLGIRHIEMRGINGKPLITHTLEEAGKVKRRLDEEGVTLSSIGSSIGKIMITDDFEPHFKLFQHTVEIAKLFETRNIRMFSFFIPREEDPERYKDEVFRRLDALGEYAAKNGVVLLHENEKDIYGDTIPRVLAIAEEFCSDSFHLVFDFANFVQCRQDTIEAWKELSSYVTYLHIKDALWENGTVVPPGAGDGNLEPVLRNLMDRGYTGFLSLEPHLSDFTGFDTLEKDTSAPRRKLTGEEAFTLSYESLMKITRRLGWDWS